MKPRQDEERRLCADLDEQEMLAWTIERIGALIHALHCVAYHSDREGMSGEPPELGPLAELGKSVCKDAYRRAYALRDTLSEWGSRALERKAVHGPTEEN